MEIIPLNNSHRDVVNEFVRTQWNGPIVVSRGNAVDTSALPGFAAVSKGELAGFVLYRVDGGECEIVALLSLVERVGVGSDLVGRVQAAALSGGCRRLWLVTTNDNTHAIRFYQKYGFALAGVHMGAVEQSRRLKDIPLTGIDGIPILHEFEFELNLAKMREYYALS